MAEEENFMDGREIERIDRELQSQLDGFKVRRGLGFWVVSVVAVVLVVVIWGMAIYFSLRAKRQEAERSAAVSVNRQEETSGGARDGQKTYVNDVYEFELDYPESVNVYDGERVSDVLGLSFMPVCDPNNSLVCFYYPGAKYRETNFEGAGLSLNVMSVGGAEDECLGEAGDDPNSTRLATGGGMSFSLAASEGAATGHRREGFNGRAYYYGTCVEAVMSLATEASDVNLVAEKKRTLSEEEKKEIFGVLEQILSSFRFTYQLSASWMVEGRVGMDRSGWKTYPNRMFGVISYPATWLVEESREGEGISTLKLSSGTSGDSRKPVLYIGSPAVFSTSGAICANKSFDEEVGAVSILVKGKRYATLIHHCGLTTGDPPKTTEEYYAFQMTLGILPAAPTVTARFRNREEAQMIANVLSAIDAGGFSLYE